MMDLNSIEPTKFAWHLWSSQELSKIPPGAFGAGVPVPKVGINASESRRIQSDGGEVRIAIIDSGFEVAWDKTTGAYVGHPDLEQVFDLAQAAEFDFGRDPFTEAKYRLRNPLDAHGTAVAGVVAGVAPNCKILPIRVSTNARPADLAAAIRYATKKADVLLLARSLPDPTPVGEALAKVRHDDPQLREASSGEPTYPPAPMSLREREDLKARKQELDDLDAALKMAISTLPVVCGAGNDGSNGLIYPARVEGVIAVGACNDQGFRSSYSQYGNSLFLVAPSNDVAFVSRSLTRKAGDERLGTWAIFTTDNLGDKGYNVDPEGNHCPARGDYPFGGTSAASAQVAAVMGLIKSVNPRLETGEVMRKLREACSLENLKTDDGRVATETAKMSAEGQYRHDEFGFGLIDVTRAVDWAEAS